MTDFKELTQTLIQTQVLAALKSAPEYIDALVQSAMSAEVNQYGGKPDGYRDQKMPWLEWCVRDQLQIAARKAVIAIVQEMQESIESSVRKALSTDDIVSACVRKIIDGTASYNVEVNVKPND